MNESLIMCLVLIFIALGLFSLIFLGKTCEENAKQFCRSKGYVDVYDYEIKGVGLDEVICMDKKRNLHLYEELDVPGMKIFGKDENDGK